MLVPVLWSKPTAVPGWVLVRVIAAGGSTRGGMRLGARVARSSYNACCNWSGTPHSDCSIIHQTQCPCPCAAGLNPVDCKVRAGEAFPFTPLTRLPKIPGGDLAGLVEQVAPGSPFKPVSQLGPVLLWKEAFKAGGIVIKLG